MSLLEQINLPKGINSRENNTGEVKLHRQYYPSRLNLYTIPPINEITIEEFESFALDRLTVLKEIEATILRNKSEGESKEYINQVLAQYLPLHTNSSSEAYSIQQERKKDHISHFILRLLNNKEKHEIKDQLRASSPHVNPETEVFFEVDFEKVLDLVRRRVVYIKGGKAYVPMRDQLALVIDEFRNRLDKALKDTCRALPEIDQEGQVMPILNQIDHQKSGQGYSCSKKIEGQITADDVDQLTEHFPLCMRHLHNKLQENKHLKHYGRMQYNLFLKGIGLSVEEALRFWRTAFSKLNDDKFQKSYAYNIRHNYGMEGKRTDYAPLNCMKIITNNQPGEGDHHGCPFRHFSEDNLSRTLYNAGVTDKAQIRQILEYAKGHHYNIACTRFFELTRGSGSKEQGMMAAINHPNEFFEKSYQLSQEGSLGNNATTNTITG
ncbi:12976_t:CDS:2 [Ambispora leptoticha]|uniref:12976_t:CDS:1 n=1 Tax=Ambispora leptoticha TaxID=144679 RepID=A0A9N9AGH8_9GLOM|nr:12976_t:CDS:2 [Ambispora leptoticha]